MNYEWRCADFKKEIRLNPDASTLKLTIPGCFGETKLASSNENDIGHLWALVPWLMMMMIGHADLGVREGKMLIVTVDCKNRT